jgi:hypothetical protein
MNYIKIDQCWKKSTPRIASIITRQQEEQAIIQFFPFEWYGKADMTKDEAMRVSFIPNWLSCGAMYNMLVQIMLFLFPNPFIM